MLTSNITYLKSNPVNWTNIDNQVIKDAILIRLFETTLLNLFQQGKISGTVHTCIGQEFSGLAFTSQLEKNDIVVSNHRCHGHFIGHKGEFVTLLAEVLGKQSGVCGGVGGSQHLHRPGFFSNGIQGGILPVAAGLALANKQQQSSNIVVVFIGDGTLGEGAVYETMNIASKWQLPLLIICENNSYAQSTSIDHNLAGDILSRAEAFDICTFSSSIHQLDNLFKDAAGSINYVRTQQKPCFHLVQTYRLAPHSKGDDYRPVDEIEYYHSIDPLNLFKNHYSTTYQDMENELNEKISIALENLLQEPTQTLEQYYDNKHALSAHSDNWHLIQSGEGNKTIVSLINEALAEALQDKRVLLIGEDLLSPYGGAFKAANNLSDKFPNQVYSTPISEAAIVGIANGLALGDYRPIVEIMFGDFVTLAVDQLINHAYKFYHMYNKQISCPIILRMPMGGYRGYGPTHSQSLERLLLGYENTYVLSLNSLLNPKILYRNVISYINHPCIIIENKLSYAQYYGDIKLPGYEIYQNDDVFPLIKLTPKQSSATITIVTYGGGLDVVLKTIQPLFLEYEIIPEIFVLTQLTPLPELSSIINSVMHTQKLLIAEEGISYANIGAEIICYLHQHIQNFKAKRCGSLPVPIPAEKKLESQILLNPAQIIMAAKQLIA